jgi:hypothetical protein
MASRLVTGLIIAPLTLIIGILCARRAPRNLIAWMLITFAYGTSSLAMRTDILPLLPLLLIANQFVSLFWLSYILIPLYFPNGQLYPPRLNQWGNRFLSAILLLLFFGTLPFYRTITWTGQEELSVPNPFFIVEFDFTVITIPLILCLLITGAMTLILRYRAGSALERLQLRWLLAGVGAQFGLLFLYSGLADTLGISTALLGSLYTVIIPIAIGNAILRYRLYDIDIIIRKTLVYSGITSILALVYFGGVAVMQSAFVALAGQESPLAVVASTLAIAALFAPVRRRVQNAVDRRFYRRKYDAAQTVDKFARAVRDEVDVDRLRGTLLGVVEDTMQPAHVSLWLKTTGKAGDRP